jgi:hypothetical protein
MVVFRLGEKKRTSGTKNSTTGTRSIVPPSKGKHCPSAYTHNDTLFLFAFPVPVLVNTRFPTNTKNKGTADMNMIAAEPIPAS